MRFLAPFLLLATFLATACASAADLTATSANLENILKLAKSGDTIRLAPGTYAQPLFVHLSYDAPVTITSQDPKHPAIFAGLGVADAKGLQFSKLELTTVDARDRLYAFRIAHAANVKFLSLDVHGDPTLAPGAQSNGFYILDSNQITISNCDIHDLDAAVSASRINGLTVRQNDFHRINKGGVEMSAVSHLLVEENVFTNFITRPPTHADLVQMFTASSNTPSHDIVIRDNLFVRGAGWAPQGIFLKDELDTRPYGDIVIERNTLLGAQWNAIYVKGFSGKLSIKDNTLASWPGSDITKPTQTDFKSWVHIERDHPGARIELSGNRAQLYHFPGAIRTLAPRGNSLIERLPDHGAELARRWLAAHPAAIRVGPRNKTPADIAAI